MAKVTAYRCQGTGLYFPDDYIENWGRNYGKGLGNRPVSECLQTKWNSPIADPGPNIRNKTQIMFPVGVGFHGIDRVEVEESEFKANRAITMKEDPFMEKRAEIIRNKQMNNKNGRLKAYAGTQEGATA